MKTTTQDIIDEAQISRGLLYYHFKGKYLSMDVDKTGRIDVEKGYPDHAVLWAKLKLHLPTQKGDKVSFI